MTKSSGAILLIRTILRSNTLYTASMALIILSLHQLQFLHVGH